MENLGPQKERGRERWAYGLQERQCRAREVKQHDWKWAGKPIPKHVRELPQSGEKRQRFVEFLIDQSTKGEQWRENNLLFVCFLSDHRTSV